LSFYYLGFSSALSSQPTCLATAPRTVSVLVLCYYSFAPLNHLTLLASATRSSMSQEPSFEKVIPILLSNVPLSSQLMLIKNNLKMYINHALRVFLIRDQISNSKESWDHTLTRQDEFQLAMTNKKIAYYKQTNHKNQKEI